MAQAQIVLFNLKNKKDVATQTSDQCDSSEFFVSLSKNKYARLYHSDSYRDLVLSFNINKSKAFIITKSMWRKLRPHILEIDKHLNKNE